MEVGSEFQEGSNVLEMSNHVMMGRELLDTYISVTLNLPGETISVQENCKKTAIQGLIILLIRYAKRKITSGQI